MKYLLDTNACVQCLRKKGNPLVLQRLLSHPPADVALCSVVVGELCHGAERSSDPRREQALVDAFVAQFTSLPYDDAAARIYAHVRHDLESRGLTIGASDYLIAGIALARNLTLVTHNTKEFSRVPGLTLEDWEVP